jgi:hypothetical protein
MHKRQLRRVSRGDDLAGRELECKRVRVQRGDVLDEHGHHKQISSVVLGYACCLAAQDARSFVKFSVGKAVDNFKAIFADPKVSSEMANEAALKLVQAKKKARDVKCARGVRHEAFVRFV